MPWRSREKPGPEPQGFRPLDPTRRPASPREHTKLRRAQGRRIRTAILLGRPVQREDRARALAWASAAGEEIKTAVWSVIGTLGLLPVGVALVPNLWLGVAWALAFTTVAVGFFFLLRLRAWGNAQAQETPTGG